MAQLTVNPAGCCTKPVKAFWFLFCKLPSLEMLFFVYLALCFIAADVLAAPIPGILDCFGLACQTKGLKKYVSELETFIPQYMAISDEDSTDDGFVSEKGLMMYLAVFKKSLSEKDADRALLGFRLFKFEIYLLAKLLAEVNSHSSSQLSKFSDFLNLSWRHVKDLQDNYIQEGQGHKEMDSVLAALYIKAAREPILPSFLRSRVYAISRNREQIATNYIGPMTEDFLGVLLQVKGLTFPKLETLISTYSENGINGMHRQGRQFHLGRALLSGSHSLN